MAAAAWGAGSCRLGGANRRLGLRRLFTALDVLAGIAVGELTQLNAERGLQTDAVEVDRLFAVGNDLGEIGVWCFGIACAATAVAVGGRVGRRTLLGAVVFVAGGRAYLLALGVGTMLVLTVGVGLLAAVCPIRSHATDRRLGNQDSPLSRQQPDCPVVNRSGPRALDTRTLCKPIWWFVTASVRDLRWTFPHGTTCC
jgi:hypothetical protein